MNGVARHSGFLTKRILLCGLLLVGPRCFTPSLNAATFFSFSSSSTAWIGAGQTLNFTSVSASRTGSLGAYTDSVHFTASGYGIDLVGPGMTLAQVGYYPNATRWPFMGSGPGMNFTSPGRGDNTLTGWFNVLQADYDQTGQIAAFAVDFVQYDETTVTRWNRGSIRYNSDIPAPGPTPPLLIGKLARTNGVVQFTLTGPANTNCIVQVSSNLLTWTPLMTNAISPVGLLTVSDPAAAAQDRRFYRVVYPGGP